MPIILRLDRVMADRKISLNELSEKVGVANVNLSKLNLYCKKRRDQNCIVTHQVYTQQKSKLYKI